MQKKLQYLVFAIFILGLIKISYATSPMLYFVDNVDSTLHVCRVQAETDLDNCRKLDTDVPNINSVAVSPDGHNVFLSTESNQVYGCIKRDDGNLTYCKPETSTFNNPQGMAFDRTHYLYIANKGNKSISFCSFTSHGIIYDCHRAGYFTISPTSISISANDKYAYVGFSEAKQIAICPIQEDLRFGQCKFIQSAHFNKPISVAADPLQKHIYIIDTASIYSGISCELDFLNQSIGKCSSHIVDPFHNPAIPAGKIGSAMDILPLRYEQQTIVYSFVAVSTGINSCIIDKDKYSCQHTNAEGYGHISSVAYATNFIYH